MNDQPPVTVGLVVQVSVLRDVDRHQLTSTSNWWQRAEEIASREWASRSPANRQTPADADSVVIEVVRRAGPNISRQLTPVASVQLRTELSPRGPYVFLTATLEPFPGLSPIPPGGEFPRTGPPWAEHVYFVKALDWRHVAGSDEERLAAEELLGKLADTVDREAWIPE